MFQTVLAIIMGFGFIGGIWNIIIGESVVLFSLTALLLDKTKFMHPVFCLLLGVVVALLFYKAVINLRAVRYIVSCLVSAGAAFVVWYDAHTKLDSTWTIFWTALTFIIVLGMHVAGYEKIKESEELEANNIYRKMRRNPAPEYYYYTRESVHQEQETQEEQAQYDYQQRTNEKKNETEAVDYYEDLFENCDSEESLKKRYRDLLKIYHPDNQNGSDEKTKKITKAYEKIQQEKFS